MRFVCSFAAATVAFSVTAAALACGGQVERAVERPALVVQQPENPQLVQAQRLEQAAEQRQMQAARQERAAMTLRAQARQLRMVANTIDGVERNNLELTAGQLGFRATRAEQRARQQHAEARQLRALAQRLRMQAAGTVNQVSRPIHRPMRRRTMVFL